MNKLSTVVLLLISLFANGRSITTNKTVNDTVYYNSKWSRVTHKSESDYYKIITFLSPDSTLAVRKMFFKSGKIYSEENFSNYKQRKKEGAFKRWYENGQLEIECNYLENSIEDIVKTYWNNGKIKRDDLFKEGKFLEGKCFDINGTEIPHFDFIKASEFSGGHMAYMKFIMKNFRTEAYIENNKKAVKGTILSCFETDIDGNISHVELIQKLEPFLDSEFVKTLMKMPKFTINNVDGNPTYNELTLPLKLDIKENN